MTQNRDRKDKIRARMAATAEPYTEAARHIDDGAGPSPAELAGRGVAAARARAEAFAADDPSHEASRARRELAGVEEWERRRAGRPVRLWAAVIETRTSALDEDDAFVRLGIYLRHPWHRTGASPLLYGDWPWRLTGSKPARPGIRDCLDQLDPAQLSTAERRRLELDYPLAALSHPGDREPYSQLDAAHVEDYLASLHRAAQRLLGQLTAAGEAELGEQRQLPAGTQLTFWRCCQRAGFLAGYDLASARARAEELAATIVDYAGRPAGRVIEIEPDDGYASAVDGLWCHPADEDGYTTRALFDDYDLAEHSTGDPAAIAAVLEDARTWLSGHYRAAAREDQAFEARLHTQADGTRTLSTPAELARVAAAARARHRGKSPAELRRAAQAADYMADRVYGRAVEDDEDFKRIEHARHEAQTLRELADDLDARGGPDAPDAGTAVQLLGPGAAGWAAQGIGVTATAGRLEISAADGELLGLVGTGPDGQPDSPVTYRAVIGDGPAGPRSVPMPTGFLPPDPARCAAGERARWGGTGTGTAGGAHARTARVVYGPGVPCPDCTCCTADGCHRGEGSDCHWSDALGDYTCPCTGG